MTTLDMTDSIAPRSDQLNADDLIPGPRTFTIAEVRKGNAEQPFDFHLTEFPGRPYKPSKSMRRVMVLAWGPNAAEYVGRKLTLYREPTIRWAGEEIGGIRISHMSHLAKPLRTALTESSKKRSPFIVQPLPDEPALRPADPSKALFAALQANGLASKEAALAYLSDLLGRDVTATKDLTDAERAEAIDDLARGDARVVAEPTTDGAA